jgi:hypothetical protein
MMSWLAAPVPELNSFFLIIEANLRGERLTL